MEDGEFEGRERPAGRRNSTRPDLSSTPWGTGDTRRNGAVEANTSQVGMSDAMISASASEPPPFDRENTRITRNRFGGGRSYSREPRMEDYRPQSGWVKFGRPILFYTTCSCRPRISRNYVQWEVHFIVRRAAPSPHARYTHAQNEYPE